MKHFDITEWSDFARGLLGHAEREAMQAHLDSGCAECGPVARVFARLVPIARAEARYEVPEYAVHCAKAISALRPPERVGFLSRLAGRLVYDSFREPLPAGVRAQHRMTRQMLYEWGDYALDLRQEHERGSGRVTLTGQIASRGTSAPDMAGLPVCLLSGKTVVARATSNRFGEFQMEYDAGRRVRLQLGRRRSSRPRPENEGGLT